jgi:hypothetical protein
MWTSSHWIKPQTAGGYTEPAAFGHIAGAGAGADAALASDVGVAAVVHRADCKAGRC